MAALVATYSDHRYRVGAVVISGGSVISRGANTTRMIDREPYHMCTEHAETCALKLAGHSARGAIVYVARIGACGVLRMSRPCPRCVGRLLASGVKRVVWTTDSGGNSARPKEMG